MTPWSYSYLPLLHKGNTLQDSVIVRVTGWPIETLLLSPALLRENCKLIGYKVLPVSLAKTPLTNLRIYVELAARNRATGGHHVHDGALWLGPSVAVLLC